MGMDITCRDIIAAVVGLLSGITVTVGYYSVKKVKVDSTKTKQSGNIVGGDQAGRDIKK
jgi:hypothetical protein